MPENRRKTGKANKTSWAKGQSGNPGGRPPLTEAQREARDMRALAQPKIVAVLESIALNVEEKAQDRINAAKALLDDDFKLDEGTEGLIVKVVKLAGGGTDT